MLSMIRDKHLKKILWTLVIVIIFAFGLGGTSYLLRGSKSDTIGTIDGKRLTNSKFGHYIKMAKLYLILDGNQRKNVTNRDIQILAIDFLVLADKAEKDKITVSDAEVIEYINTTLFPKVGFNQEAYQRFIQFISQRYNLSLTSRTFEEYVREFIAKDKLLEKYVKVEVKEEEIRDFYAKENQKAKINYLYIPYEKFRMETGVTSEELKNFYSSNKDRFRRQPKIKIKYLLLDRKDPGQIEQVLKYLPKAQNIDQLKEELGLKIKESEFITIDDPIKEIGWQPQINKIAFSLKLGKISPLIQTAEGAILIEKTKEQPAYTPLLAEIKDEVKEVLIRRRAVEKTKELSEDLLNKISTEKITDLSKLSDNEIINFKETEYFKFDDYIEGLGMDQKISEIIFSLKPLQIYRQALLRDNGAYIIQLSDLTAFDETGYREEKTEYQQRMEQEKRINKSVEFLLDLKKSAKLNLDPNQ